MYKIFRNKYCTTYIIDIFIHTLYHIVKPEKGLMNK